MDAVSESGHFGTFKSFLEPIKPLMELDIDKLQKVTHGLKAVIYNLSDIGKMGAPGLESLTSIFKNLSKAMDALDVDKLRDISNVNAENLRKLSSVFQQPVSVGNTTVGRTSVNSQQTQTQTSHPEAAITNKKLDEAIGILRQILSSTNQPVYIKVGDRTVEAIGEILSLKSVWNVSHGRTFGKSTDS
jgi:hypothetical protein